MKKSCNRVYVYVMLSTKDRDGKPSHTHTWIQILNPSTSAKPFINKLQSLFVALVNMDIFHITLNFSLFTVD